MAAVMTLDPATAELQQKVDQLSEQAAFLVAEAHQQQQRRQQWDELKHDMTPIMNDLYRLSVEQLAEVEDQVQLEDIMVLFKQLLRSTRNMTQLLAQLESGLELMADAGPLGRDAFLSLINQLNELEQKGYFIFAKGGLEIVDKIVTAFDEEDIRQLGDNVVLILQTIKEMTQPEIMTFMHNTVSAVKAEEPTEVSLLGIIRQLNDPAVKRGLAKTLQVLKSVSEN